MVLLAQPDVGGRGRALLETGRLASFQRVRLSAFFFASERPGLPKGPQTWQRRSFME